VALPRLWVPIHAHHTAWTTLWQTSLAVFLYCHGVSMNALSKMFGVRTSSVLKWIRRYATTHGAKPEPTGKAIVLECDEMWHFLKKTPEALDLEGS
jgi:transposase-like protein